MALIIKDRVKEGTTTTGTGDISLAGAGATFKAFNAYMSNGDTTYYAIVHTTTSNDEWEVGLGTWNTGNTLSRTTVLASSNSNNAVNFSSGTKDIFMSYPADKAVIKDANGEVALTPTAIDDTVIGGTTPAAGSFTDLDTSGEIDVGTHIDFAIQSAHASYQEGRLWYDSIHKTLNFYSDNQNVIHEIGLEEHQRVYNNTGSTIGKGKPLYFSGNYTAGSIDVPTVGLADATSSSAYNAQGLAAADIADGSYGYCIVAGQLDGLDTSGLTAGTNFFVGLTPGAVQNASPVYPNYPMCLGWVVNSDSTNGILLVNQQNHSVNSFRVQSDAHIGSDLIVGGNLSVLGTTTTTSTSDVTAGAPFYRANEGDAIGEANTTFSGSGLDDAFFSGHFTGTTSTTYYVKIDGTGTPDTFSVSTDNFATTISTGTAITGSEQLIHSADNIFIKFGATTGHTLNDTWTGTAGPVLVDTGFFSNRNTGTTGVGYTHMGFFYDVSTDKWTLLDEYDPTPSGTINLADSSVSYGTLKLDTVEGSLSGNATTATTLATARNIAGQAFDGSADINIAPTDLTGVTSTAAEINILDGVTATTAEVNLLDGVTATTEELNILDGVTATATELNILDGVTATTAELNILDGVTADATELNLLDGVTATTAELNYVDGVTSNIQTQIDAKQPYLTIAVTVSNPGSGNKYYLDGALQQTALLPKSVTIRFDQSDSSNASHPLVLSATSDGTHNSGSAFTTGVTTVGTPGSAGAYTQVTLEQDAPDTLYYYCSNHSGMGGTVYSGKDFSTLTSTITELNLLDGVTATTAELNILDGVTSTAAELNILDGVTASTAEINLLDGVTASTAELNILDGVTSTAAELNILDGVTSTAAELNILDGVTATTAELNILDGVTSTAAELNILDGVTATATELNYLDITTLGTSEASKAVTADGSGDVNLAASVYAATNIGKDSGDYITFTTDTQLDVYINGSNEFRFEADGDFHADGDVIAYSTTVASDERLKQNIKPVEDATSKLQALDGVTFEWSRTGQESAGVIAQQVKKVLPQAVKEVKGFNGENHLTVNYSALTSLLIESIKELKAEIEELKNGSSD